MKIGIIGKGVFGLSLKKAFSSSHKIAMYGYEVKDLNPKTVPKLLFLTIPSDAEMNNQNAVKFYINYFNKSSIILTSKGLDTLSIYKSLIPKEKERVFIFSGPNLSDQLGETPSAVILANENLEKSKILAKLLSNRFLTVIPSASPLVVQFGGVLKNLLVFYLGQYWHEFTTLEKKIQAIVESVMAGASIIKKNKNIAKNFAEFYGISGVGDLLLCIDLFPVKRSGLLSRNFLAGQALVRGATEKEMYQRFKTVEGYKAVKTMRQGTLAKFDTPELNQFLQNLKKQKSTENLEIDFQSQSYQEMHLEWKNFKREARQQHYFSNTFAWKFCEILADSAKKNSLDLSKEEDAKALLRQLLYIALSARK